MVSTRALAGVALAACAVVALFEDASAGARVHADDMIVVLKGHAVPAAVARRHGVVARRTYGHALKGFAGRIPPGLLRKLAADPDVAYIERDAMAEAAMQTLPTGVNRIGADQNVHANIDGNDERVPVDIAILDSGIDLDHPDLHVVEARSFMSYTTSAEDDYGHGTHVAGIAAALDNGIGVVGVAPGAKLWALKVLDNTGVGPYSDIIAAIDYVTQHATEIEVANMSLGGYSTSSALWQAIRASVAHGVVYVAAAGNNLTEIYGASGTLASNAFTPAAFPEVLAVSALGDTDGQAGGNGAATSYDTPDDAFASWTNYSASVVPYNPVNSPGAAIDLAAPGVDIYSTYLNGGYEYYSGTSMASPHVAGAVALLIAQYGRANNAAEVAAIRQALIDSAEAQTLWRAGQPDPSTDDPDANPEGLVRIQAPPAPLPDYNAPPVVSIITPVDGATYGGGQVVLFRATAVDPENGDVAASLMWTSSKHGYLGAGPSLTYTITYGTQVITAYATDGEGKAGYDAAVIEVRPDHKVDVIVYINNAGGQPQSVFQDGEDVYIDVYAVDPGWPVTANVTCRVYVPNGYIYEGNGPAYGGMAYFIFTCDAAADGVGHHSVMAEGRTDAWNYGIGTGYFQVQGGANSPPAASGDAHSVDEDATLNVSAPGVLGNDFDPDGDALAAVLVSAPSSGSLTLNPDGSFGYTPEPDFHGSDSFTYKASDGMLDSNPATVSLTVQPVNDAPVADSQSVATDNETTLAVTLTASDVDGDPLSYTVVSGPSHGSLSGVPPELTYTPNEGHVGDDSFTFVVNDGQADSNTAAVSIAVTQVNHPPVAYDQSVITSEDTSVDITLDATDPDDDLLTYSIVAGPSQGTLSGTPPIVTYTPSPNYNGSDSFTFKANDGEADSNIATVGLMVQPVNDAPVAGSQNVTTDNETPLAVTLTASDVDGDLLSYTVVSGPSHGSLSGDPPDLTYTPSPGYVGEDSFTFVANDGLADSNTATVSITVTQSNHPPIAYDQDVTTPEDTPVDIVLSASDEDDDPLSYNIVAGPTGGMLSGTMPNATYTPNPNYYGSDDFTFKANDGEADSNIATVTITVTAVNDAPATPEGLVATAGADSVSLDWQDNAEPENDLVGYNVYKGASSGSYGPPTFTAQSAWLDTDVDPGVTYYYVVTAVDAQLESGSSEEVSATVPEPNYDAYVVADPFVTFGSVVGSYELTKDPDEPSQQIQEDPSGKAGASSLDAEYTLHTTADPTSISSLTLHFAITWSDLDSTDDPLSVSVWNCAGGQWEDITVQALDPGAFTPSEPRSYVDAQGNIVVQFADTAPIKKEKKDTLSVDLLYAQIAAGGPAPDLPPEAPTGLTAVPGDSQVSLDWDDNGEPDIAGYHVYRGPLPAAMVKLTAAPLPDSQYTDASVINGELYCYAVTAVDQGGNESAASASVSVTPGAQPTLHVWSIDVVVQPAGRKHIAVATVLIHDQDGNGVPGATVRGEWYFRGVLIQADAAGDTDGAGAATLYSPPKKTKTGDVSLFRVTDVVAIGYTYDPGQNVETEDSGSAP